MEKIKAKNYVPGSMSFAAGFFGVPVTGNVGYIMVADWEKAQAIIKQLISEGRNIESVEMGLDGDWDYNSMTVWENGRFFKYDCYDSSIWAEPIIIVNYKDTPSEAYACWKRKEKPKN